MSSAQSHPPVTPIRRAMAASGQWVGRTGTGVRQPAVETPAAGLRQAASLLGAATRMLDSGDLDTLAQVIAREALDLISADGVVVLTHVRRGLTSVLNVTSTAGVADPSIHLRCSRLSAAYLLEPGRVADLDLHRSSELHPLTGDSDPATSARWRSLLVADLDGPRSRGPARLLWYTRTPDAFRASADLAVLFAGHAALALRTVAERHHLEVAIDRRTVTGQATGIVMSRDQLTGEQAFEVLKRYSQNHNIKLHDLAETVIRIGGLPG